MGSSFGVISQTGNNIQTEGLVFYVDASINKSYPGSGTTWFDLKDNNNGTLSSSPTFEI